jgi:cytochrome c553
MKLSLSLLLAVLPVSVALASPAASAPAAAPAVAPIVTKGDASKALTIVNNVCGACHGADGNSTAPIYPNLAGQTPEYINKQLTEFKSGARKNAIMAPNVTNLSAADMLNLAAYFSAQTPKSKLAKDAALVAEGKRLYMGGNAASGVPACASCHGPSGAGIPVQFPRMAGQHAKYVQIQLANFRSGDRSNDGGKMMQVIARKMTDQEMRAVGEYISGLR